MFFPLFVKIVWNAISSVSFSVLIKGIPTALPLLLKSERNKWTIQGDFLSGLVVNAAKCTITLFKVCELNTDL